MFFFRPRSTHLKLRAGKRSVNLLRIKPTTHDIIWYHENALRILCTSGQTSDFSLRNLLFGKVYSWCQLATVMDMSVNMAILSFFSWTLSWDQTCLWYLKSLKISSGINVCKTRNSSKFSIICYKQIDQIDSCGVVCVVGLSRQLNVLPVSSRSSWGMNAGKARRAPLRWLNFHGN